MLPEAYGELHKLQEYHWWYVGARFVYRTLLDIAFGEPGGTKPMLEVGCGSGGNLALLGEFGPTVGIDVSWEALRMVSQRPALGLVQAGATALPFQAAAFDGVHLLGVIEHLDDDTTALEEARRVCRPDGAVMLLTSALSILWSHHDDANLHKRRYTLNQLRELIVRSGLSPLRISYQNFFTFLPTFVIRMGQRLAGGQPRYDMGSPPPFLNAVLIWVMRFEAWLIKRLPLPIGVDLVAVCRPRMHPS
jgi:SAM-dependent methyltransferase